MGPVPIQNLDALGPFFLEEIGDKGKWLRPSFLFLVIGLKLDCPNALSDPVTWSPEVGFPAKTGVLSLVTSRHPVHWVVHQQGVVPLS